MIIMLVRFDSRAEEKKQKEFVRQRRQAIESFILYDDEEPYKRFCRKYKIQIPVSRYVHLKNIMTLALMISCTEMTKSIARKWLDNHDFTEEDDD